MTQRPSAFASLSYVALAVAAIVFVWSTITAIRTTTTEPLTMATSKGDSAVVPASRAALDDTEIERAVAHDIFSVLRQPPPRRYTLDVSRAPTSDDEVDVTTLGTEEPPPTLPTVHGTAVGGDGRGFAMCSTDGQPVRVVRVGDTVGAFTVMAIERTRVTFRDTSGHRVIVDALPSPAGDER